MSAFDLFTKTRAYFITNWITTPLQVPEIDFTNNNYIEYIRFEYVADGGDIVGYDYPNKSYGYVKIHCYNKNEILSVKLAETVKTFFDNRTDVGSEIVVKDGKVYPTVKIDNGYYDTLVMFRVTKY